MQKLENLNGRSYIHMLFCYSVTLTYCSLRQSYYSKLLCDIQLYFTFSKINALTKSYFSRVGESNHEKSSREDSSSTTRMPDACQLTILTNALTKSYFSRVGESNHEKSSREDSSSTTRMPDACQLTILTND